jgi:hypothetical protein
MAAEVKHEVERLEASIALFNRLIPIADGLALQTFLLHRDWDSRTLAQLSQFAHA